ncbi:MAG TPA: Rieske 2Fe-2S domain-containing protein [Candidatus Thermoplasmatota archaeon]|nr:Rieske 2Fe-2S domain-containing protein [Candidatus Thermoplasmatota archaeon]
MANDPVPHGRGVRTPPHPGESPKGEPLLSRRDFIRNTVRLAVAGAIIPGALSQLLPAVAPASLGGGGAGPIIRRPDPKDKSKKVAITIDDLAGPAPVVLTAEWNFLPAVVYKVKVAALQGSSKHQGYNTAQHAVEHPTEPAHAIIAYIGKCKHLGCTVGWNGALGAAINKDVGLEDYDGDGINDGRILCPCHQGQYDIYNLARNQPATPPPEPLNVIRINVDDYSDPDGKVPSASNAIIGVVRVDQAKYKDADLDGKKGITAFALRKATDPKIEA